MSKNITSFAAFLEQTERKPEKIEATRAESVPDTKTTSDINSVPHTENASHPKITPHVESASRKEIGSDVKIHAEPVRKVRDAEIASHAEITPVRGHLRVPNEVLYNIL